MATTALGGRFTFPGTSLTVGRLGYGAMQLAGPGVFGPPKDRVAAIAVLRAAVEAGVDHIDTSDFYGPHVANELIREALYPYPPGLVIVTKVGARRTADGAWLPATSRAELIAAVHENLRNLGVETLDVVNFRTMVAGDEGPLAEEIGVLADLVRDGLIRHVGVSGVTRNELAEARRVTAIVCVQNRYNLAAREDDAFVDELARDGIAYVPFFPLGGFTPLQSATLSAVAARLGATTHAVALAWLLQRSPNVLPIPGTASRAHLRENLAAAELVLSPADVRELDAISTGAASPASE